MKNKLLSASICCIMIFTLIIGAAVASAESVYTAGDIDNIIGGILSYKLEGASVSAWINGALTKGAGTISEWYVIALAQSGVGYDFSAYKKALEAYAEENKNVAAVTRQRYALAYIAAGGDNAFANNIIEETAGTQGIMSIVFALHLLNNGCTCTKYTRESAVSALLSMRLEDGGWSLTGNNSEIDVTAMTIHALAPYYESADTKAAVESALETLSMRQLEDGDFISFGAANPESTAQVITALSALGIDALTDERFIKNGKTLLDGLMKYRLENGAFCHTAGGEYNNSATMQAFYSLIALKRQQEGKGALFMLDKNAAEAESKLGYKSTAYIVIAALFAAVCVILICLKKTSAKNYLFCAGIAVVAVCAVMFTDIQSADEYYSPPPQKSEIIGTVTLSVRCDTIAGKTEYAPESGVILENVVLNIARGDTVYDILKEAARIYKLHVDSSVTVTGAYVSGINYLYEYSYGALSGWVYSVNGVMQSVGSDSCVLNNGDIIVWSFTSGTSDFTRQAALKMQAFSGKPGKTTEKT